MKWRYQMETKQTHTPKFLAPYVCPECGKGAEVEDMQDKNDATFWRLVCSGCGLNFTQWTSGDIEPTSLEYQGEDYSLEADPDPVKEALLAACKEFVADADAVGGVDYLHNEWPDMAETYLRALAAIALDEKGTTDADV